MEIGYHYSNLEPSIILKRGLSRIGRLYGSELTLAAEEYLPIDHIYVVKSLNFLDYLNESKYVYKVDITGLFKYPDYGTFPSTGAILEEVGMWWEEDRIDDIEPKELRDIVRNNGGNLGYEEVRVVS